MKKIKFLIAVVFIPIAFFACSGGGSSSGAAVPADADTYTMSVLPTKYAVDVPASISGDAAADKSSKGILQKVTSKGAPGIGDTSTGCQQMKQMTGMMKQMTGMMGFFAVLADASISQNNISADENEHTGTVTLTQDMIDAVAAIMPADMADASQMAGAIGQQMPAMVTYSDNGTDDYVYSVLLTMTSEMGSQTAKIYWNEAKTNTKLELTMPGMGTLIFTYDDTIKLMTATMSSTMGTMELSLKEDGTGALFFANMGSTAGTYRMEGFADDNGGYIKTTMISSSFGTFISEEAFDVNGNITFDDGSYSADYTSGADDISTLQGEIGISISTDLPVGQYIVVNDSLLTSSTALGTQSKVVGVGIVSSGMLIIQDIGGGAYSSAGSVGTTVYLFKVTDGDDFFDGNTPVFEATQNTVTF